MQAEGRKPPLIPKEQTFDSKPSASTHRDIRGEFVTHVTRNTLCWPGAVVYLFRVENVETSSSQYGA